MRFCPSLQLFAAFICFASSIPHALAHPSLPPQLTQTLFSLTRTDHELRDAAMAIMEGAASHEHPVAHRLLHRRGRYSIYLPNHKAGYPPARDSLYNINAVLDELSIYFPDLAQDIRDAIGIMQTASSMSLTPLEPPSTTSQLEQPSTSALPPTHPPDTPITTPVSLPTSRTQPTPTPITSLGEPVIATPSSTSPPPSSSTYTFNPQRRDLNVAYYAQSPPTTQVPFLDLCSDPSIDIILLSFITDFFSVGGFPTLNLASKCWGLDSNTLQGATAIQKGVSGLIDCISPGFAKEVAQCQTSGKKVMLSAGGAKEYSNLNMPSEQKAIELAGTIWSLFLGGTDPEITPLRPFGNVTLDGIDIDNEDPANAVHLSTFVSTLRRLYSNDTSSQSFYLSAAPQCPRPDVSIPVSSLLPNLDFVSVQFYNNPSCNLGTDGLIPSIQAWSNDLLALIPDSWQDVGNGFSGPKLLIGAPADPAAAVAGGFVSQDVWKTGLEYIKSLGIGNLGGAMFWDGSYLELEKAKSGSSWADAVREVLG